MSEIKNPELENLIDIYDHCGQALDELNQALDLTGLEAFDVERRQYLIRSREALLYVLAATVWRLDKLGAVRIEEAPDGR